jgi:hypothetical protein
MKKSRGTEKEIQIDNNLNTHFGSVDKNDPKSIYIKFSSWSNTISYDESNNYKRIITDLTKKIKSYLYRDINTDIFHNDIVIVDMDMRESGISGDKPSFMSCEVTLYQRGNYKLNNNTLLDEMNKLSETACKEIFNRHRHFEFYKHKEEALKVANESLIV